MGTRGGPMPNREPRFGLWKEPSEFERGLNEQYDEECREAGHPYCFDHEGVGYCFCMEKTYPLGNNDPDVMWNRMMGQETGPDWYRAYLSWQSYHGDSMWYNDSYSDMASF